MKLRCEGCREENKRCEETRPCRYCVDNDKECIVVPRKGRGHGTRVKAVNIVFIYTKGISNNLSSGVHKLQVIHYV